MTKTTGQGARPAQQAHPPCPPALGTPAAEPPTAAAEPPTAAAEPPYISQWGDMAGNIAYLEHGQDPAPLVDWRAQGYPSAGAYRMWSRSTCGLACLESAARAEGRTMPFSSKWEMICSAIDAGIFAVEGDPRTEGFWTAGLIYAPCVDWARRHFGLQLRSCPDLPLDTVVRELSRGQVYAVLSVSNEIRNAPVEPVTRGGHLVLVYGVADGPVGGPGGGHEDSSLGRSADAASCRLVFHNPSGIHHPASGGQPEVNTASSVRMAIGDFARHYAGRGMLISR